MLGWPTANSTPKALPTASELLRTPVPKLSTPRVHKPSATRAAAEHSLTRRRPAPLALSALENSHQLAVFSPVSAKTPKSFVCVDGSAPVAAEEVHDSLQEQPSACCGPHSPTHQKSAWRGRGTGVKRSGLVPQWAMLETQSHEQAYWSCEQSSIASPSSMRSPWKRSAHSAQASKDDDKWSQVSPSQSSGVQRCTIAKDVGKIPRLEQLLQADDESLRQLLRDASAPTAEQQAEALQLEAELNALGLTRMEALAHIFISKFGTLDAAFDWFNFAGTGAFCRAIFDLGILLVHVDVQRLTSMTRQAMFSAMDTKHRFRVDKIEWDDTFSRMGTGTQDRITRVNAESLVNRSREKLIDLLVGPDNGRVDSVLETEIAMNAMRGLLEQVDRSHMSHPLEAGASPSRPSLQAYVQSQRSPAKSSAVDVQSVSQSSAEQPKRWSMLSQMSAEEGHQHQKQHEGETLPNLLGRLSESRVSKVDVLHQKQHEGEHLPNPLGRLSESRVSNVDVLQTVREARQEPWVGAAPNAQSGRSSLASHQSDGAAEASMTCLFKAASTCSTKTVEVTDGVEVHHPASADLRRQSGISSSVGVLPFGRSKSEQPTRNRRVSFMDGRRASAVPLRRVSVVLPSWRPRGSKLLPAQAGQGEYTSSRCPQDPIVRKVRRMMTKVMPGQVEVLPAFETEEQMQIAEALAQDLGLHLSYVVPRDGGEPQWYVGNIREFINQTYSDLSSLKEGECKIYGVWLRELETHWLHKVGEALGLRCTAIGQGRICVSNEPKTARRRSVYTEQEVQAIADSNMEESAIRKNVAANAVNTVKVKHAVPDPSLPAEVVVMRAYAKQAEFLRRSDLANLIKDAMRLLPAVASSQTSGRQKGTASVEQKLAMIFEDTVQLQIDLGERCTQGLTPRFFKVFLGKVAQALGWSQSSCLVAALKEHCA